MIPLDTIICGDCLEEMKKLPDGCIDMILCDLPYGTTACKWDHVIPFEPLWKEYKRLIKDRGAIVLTASQPFTSALVMSNPGMFKYELIWNKVFGVSAINSKFRPMTSHENILIFYDKCPPFNPIYQERTEFRPVKPKSRKSDIDAREYVAKNVDFINSKEKNPVSVITVNRFAKECNPLNRIHPTQKPVALFEYLIKTYTNEGDLVLDNCIGSGTTAVAAKRTGRHFIGIELSSEYCDIARKRVASVPARLDRWEGMA